MALDVGGIRVELVELAVVCPVILARSRCCVAASGTAAARERAVVKCVPRFSAAKNGVNFFVKTIANHFFHLRSG